MNVVTPRYIEIRRAIEDRIMSGDWRPGDRVPSEHELMAQYGCSRMTVNKAVSALSAAGLVVRRRRSGSFVAAPQTQETVLEIHDIKGEITASGRAYRYEIIGRELRGATEDDRRRLDIARQVAVLHVKLVHFAADIPYVLEDRLIHLRHVPQARKQDFADEPPGTWLLAHIPWTNAEHRIRAVAASRESAKALGIDAGDPCLLIERRTWQMLAAITQVALTYPGHRHELVGKFYPSSEPAILS